MFYKTPSGAQPSYDARQSRSPLVKALGRWCFLHDLTMEHKRTEEYDGFVLLPWHYPGVFFTESYVGEGLPACGTVGDCWGPLSNTTHDHRTWNTYKHHGIPRGWLMLK